MSGQYSINPGVLRVKKKVSYLRRHYEWQRFYIIKLRRVMSEIQNAGKKGYCLMYFLLFLLLFIILVVGIYKANFKFLPLP